MTLVYCLLEMLGESIGDLIAEMTGVSSGEVKRDSLYAAVRLKIAEHIYTNLEID